MTGRDNRSLAALYRGRWQQILVSFGVPAGALMNQHGPCPVPSCGGRDRFRFDNLDGRGTWFCNHCGAGDGPRLVMLFLGLDFKAAAAKVREVIGDEYRRQTMSEKRDSLKQPRIEAPSANLDLMNNLWLAGQAVANDNPAGRYLTRRLGHLPECRALRSVNQCRYADGTYHAAMLAIFTGQDGNPASLHRTYLDVQGNKAAVKNPKQVLGRMAAGGAVRLTLPAMNLGIAEGIETALAASMLFRVPVWAALNAASLAVWTPPPETRKVIIFADNDASGTGQLSAFKLAGRIEGRVEVEIQIPRAIGSDWADIIAET